MRQTRLLLATTACLAAALSLAGVLLIPAPGAPLGTTGAVQAGRPFTEQDPGGATLLCVSSLSGRVLPPYLVVSSSP